MGGQAYLTRLAFGRSPYEQVQPPQSEEQQSTNQQESSRDDNGYTQQYDQKGNPVNEAAARRTAAERAAKNEVLAAVGVVEKKNSQADQPGGKVSFSEEEWKIIQDQENVVGENVRLAVDCVRHASSWWLIALRRRIQAGIINSNQPFTNILTHEWHIAARSGLSGLFRYLTIGALPELVGQILALITEHMIEELHIKLCELTYRLRLRRPQRQRLLRYLDHLNVGLLISAQILLSPFAISASLLQLGLVASTQQMSFLVPWSSMSALRWAWFRRADVAPLGSQTLAIILSPASLWSFSNILYQSLSLNYGATPFCPASMITGPTDLIRRRDHSDSSETRSRSLKTAPALLHPFLHFRDVVLHRLGWSESVPLRRINKPDPVPLIGNQHSTNPSSSSSPSPSPTLPPQTQPQPTRRRTKKRRHRRNHRTTSLAEHPSRHLAQNIDTLFSTLLFLPLESLFLRTLVSAFYASGLASSASETHSPPSSVFAPFKGPLLESLWALGASCGSLGATALGVGRNVTTDALRRRRGGLGGEEGGAWWVAYTALGDYASKISLCIGGQFLLDSAIWGGVYWWVRWTGKSRFGWGE